MAKDQRLTKEEIQEDKFIEGVLHAYQFLKDNLRTIVIVVGVVVVGVVGYFVYQQDQASRRSRATIALRSATESYQSAESSLFDSEKLAESETLLGAASAELRSVFESHSGTRFADLARYQYASSLYYQGDYAGARRVYAEVISDHHPENALYVLYAQKAIGNAYEQEGRYDEAIAAYQSSAFPPTPGVSPEIRRFVLMEARFNQALVSEKTGDAGAARGAYQELIDEFRATLETGIREKSRESLEVAKAVAAAIGESGESVDTSAAAGLERSGQYFEAYVAYRDAIRAYRIAKDISGGLASALRAQLAAYEETADLFISNIENARRADSEGKQTSAVYAYDAVVGFDSLGLSRRLYENALLHVKRLESVD